MIQNCRKGHRKDKQRPWNCSKFLRSLMKEVIKVKAGEHMKFLEIPNHLWNASLQDHMIEK